MSARMTDRRSVAANAVVDNIISGKLHEFLSRPSVVRVLGTASAVGLNISVLVGGESVVQDQEMSAANRFPVTPDDHIVDAGGFQGDRIVVSLRNTTGGALTANVAVDVIPLR